VAPTPPPITNVTTSSAAGGGGKLKVGDTLAARLKAEATRRALEEGRFDSEEARDRRRAELEQAARAAAKRATAVWQHRAVAAGTKDASAAPAEAPTAAVAAQRTEHSTQQPQSPCAVENAESSPANVSPRVTMPTSKSPTAAAARSSRSMSPRAAAVQERRAALSAHKEVPVMHREARHAQAAAHARALVEDALLAAGIDALRYVKEA